MSVNVAMAFKKAGHEVDVYAARVGDEAIPGIQCNQSGGRRAYLGS